MTTHAAMLLAFFASGFALEHARALRGDALHGFAFLYGVALLARLGSAVALARKAPLLAPGPRPPRLRLGAVIAAGRWRVALYAAALLFGAQLAIPFFTPYMLRELRLDLTEFPTVPRRGEDEAHGRGTGGGSTVIRSWRLPRPVLAPASRRHSWRRPSTGSIRAAQRLGATVATVQIAKATAAVTANSDHETTTGRWSIR